jgi:hypothetical protein
MMYGRVYESVYGGTALVDLDRFIQFLNLYAVGRNPWMGDQPVAKPVPSAIPRVGFEPTVPAFELAKTVHALDCTATVIGRVYA